MYKMAKLPVTSYSFLWVPEMPWWRIYSCTKHHKLVDTTFRFLFFYNLPLHPIHLFSSGALTLDVDHVCEGRGHSVAVSSRPLVAWRDFLLILPFIMFLLFTFGRLGKELAVLRVTTRDSDPLPPAGIVAWRDRGIQNKINRLSVPIRLVKKI